MPPPAPTQIQEPEPRFPRRQILIALAAVVVTGGGLLAYSLQQPATEQSAGPTPKPSTPPATSAPPPTAVALAPSPMPSPTLAVAVRASLVGTIQKVSDVFDIVGMRFAPDGQTLVVATNRHVSMWKVADRSKQREWEPKGGRIDCMALTPDGYYVATGTATADVIVTQTTDERQTLSLAGHRNGISDLAFTRDGMILGSASDDATVRLWRTVDGGPLNTLQVPSRLATALAFSPDNTVIAIGAYGFASHLRGPDLQRTNDLGGSTAHQPTAITFSPDGKLVAIGWSYDAVRVSGVDDGSLLYELTDPPGSPATTITDIVFSPDGRTIMAGRTSVNRVSIWSLTDGKLVGQIVPSQTSTFFGLAFSPTTSMLAMGTQVGDDRNIELWSLA